MAAAVEVDEIEVECPWFKVGSGHFKLQLMSKAFNNVVTNFPAAGTMAELKVLIDSAPIHIRAEGARTHPDAETFQASVYTIIFLLISKRRGAYDMAVRVQMGLVCEALKLAAAKAKSMGASAAGSFHRLLSCWNWFVRLRNAPPSDDAMLNVPVAKQIISADLAFLPSEGDYGCAIVVVGFEAAADMEGNHKNGLGSVLCTNYTCSGQAATFRDSANMLVLPILAITSTGMAWLMSTGADAFSMRHVDTMMTGAREIISAFMTCERFIYILYHLSDI